MNTMPRNAQLDHLIRTRGWYIAFYDPEGTRYGLPTYPWRCVPDGYATTRQLRAQGLRPGGQPIQGQMLWRHRKHVRVAYLYKLADAKPKRDATPAQLHAIAKALIARRTCGTCREVKDYYIPTSLGECLDCNECSHMCLTCYTYQDYAIPESWHHQCATCYEAAKLGQAA